MSAPRHGRRIVIIWFLLTAVLTPLVVFVGGPHLPPQQASVQARHQQVINTLLAGMVTPILLAIIVYTLYTVVLFRQRRGVRDANRDAGVQPPREDRRVTTAWLAVNFVVLVVAVVYGTWDWIGPGVGSGSAQGATPLARPPGEEPLEVQVIGQQWQWTFRYPDYQGVETAELVIPEHRYIEFHVTSLDVVHSFWAVGLAIKADAVPGADNIVYVRANDRGSVRVQCSELCGLFHGQMYQVNARVDSQDKFDEWIAEQQQTYADILQYLPPYAHTYSPAPENLAS